MDATATRMDEAEQQISNIEDKLTENNEAEKKRETKAKEHNLRIREIDDSLKRNNIRIIGVPEEEERQTGVEGLCEQILAENFPNLGKDTDQNPGSTEDSHLIQQKPTINKAYHRQIHTVLRQEKNHESSKGKKCP